MMMTKNFFVRYSSSSGAQNGLKVNASPVRLEYAAALSLGRPRFENMMFDAVDTVMYTVPMAK